MNLLSPDMLIRATTSNLGRGNTRPIFSVVI